METKVEIKVKGKANPYSLDVWNGDCMVPRLRDCIDCGQPMRIREHWLQPYRYHRCNACAFEIYRRKVHNEEWPAVIATLPGGPCVEGGCKEDKAPQSLLCAKHASVQLAKRERHYQLTV